MAEKEVQLRARTALIAAPACAVALFVAAPAGVLSPAALAVACVGIVMATWWTTEAVPLPATALLPLVLFPVLGVAEVETTAAAYAHPLIFLFLGGFLLAQAMQRWQLNRRVAQRILRYTGDRPAGIVAGIMVATAFLSMWVSNTATAMMMLPIGQSIVRARGWSPQAPDSPPGPASALMLAIAYAATIGGMGTLIGTPPNALFAGFMSDAYGVEVGFARWMLVGVPAVLVLLPVAWLVLTRICFKLPSEPAAANMAPIGEGEPQPQPLSAGARRTALVVVLAAAAWTLRPLVEYLLPGLAISDAGIALAAALALFIVPAGGSEGGPLLTWDEAAKIRWDVLILFGGGLALADAIGSSGLAAWIASATAGIDAVPFVVLLVLVSALIVVVGELASNTAMAAIFLPIAAATAAGLGAAPLDLAIPVALAASLGFMLPVATPPNAIVYGSGTIQMRDMVRAGVVLDVVGVVVVSLLASTIGRWVFAGV